MPYPGTIWKELGIAKAFVSTLRKCLLDPRVFFNELSISRSNPPNALLYALILGSIGSVFSFAWTYLLIGPLLDFLPWMDDYSGQKAPFPWPD
jgi:hypothetical protein